MSRTYRRPPPRRRLRAGYVSRLCWRCRYPVATCSCPARDLVQAPPVDDPKIVDEAFIEAVSPDWRCCVSWCSCASDLSIASAPLTQPLAALLRAA